MTNESDFVDVVQPPITHKIQGISPFSMIEGLLAFQPDDYYNDAFRDSVRIAGLRDQFMAQAGAELDEAAGAAPFTAHKGPQGEWVNPNPPPGAPPVQQQPPAAPQGALRGVQPGRVVPLEACDRCNGPAKYKEAFQSRQGKQISATLICTNPQCKDGNYDHNIRWLNGDDPAWVKING